MLATNKDCNFHYVKSKNVDTYFNYLKILSRLMLQSQTYAYLELLVIEKLSQLFCSYSHYTELNTQM